MVKENITDTNNIWLRRCPVCGSVNIEPIIRHCRSYVPRLSQLYDVYLCKQCGLFFINPQPTRKAFKFSYPDECHFSLKLGRLEYFVNAFLKALNRRSGYNAWVLPPYEKGSDILDVGCGEGHFLEYARKMGYNAEGIEPDPVSVNFLRRKGFNVIQGFAEDTLKIIKKKYDAIYFTHVLEHTWQPITILKEASKILKKEGWMVITVPNARWCGYTIFKRNCSLLVIPQHLFHFTPAWLIQQLTRIGFHVTSIKFQVFPFAYARSLQMVFGIYRIVKRHLKAYMPLSFLMGITSLFITFPIYILSIINPKLFCPHFTVIAIKYRD